MTNLAEDQDAINRIQGEFVKRPSAYQRHGGSDRMATDPQIRLEIPSNRGGSALTGSPSMVLVPPQYCVDRLNHPRPGKRAIVESSWKSRSLPDSLEYR